MNSIMFRVKERAIADNGNGLADDPVYSEPVMPPDNTARKVVELGDQIRERKTKLKSEGLTGLQIDDDAAIQKLWTNSKR